MVGRSGVSGFGDVETPFESKVGMVTCWLGKDGFCCSSQVRVERANKRVEARGKALINKGTALGTNSV